MGIAFATKQAAILPHLAYHPANSTTVDYLTNTATLAVEEKRRRELSTTSLTTWAPPCSRGEPFRDHPLDYPKTNSTCHGGRKGWSRSKAGPHPLNNAGGLPSIPLPYGDSKGHPQSVVCEFTGGDERIRCENEQGTWRLRGSLRHLDHHPTIITDMAAGSRATIEPWPPAQKSSRRSWRQQFHDDQMNVSTIIRQSCSHTPVYHHG